jgi:hypothetical protein
MLASVATALGGIAFYLGALFVHQKSGGHNTIQWIAAVTAFVGGVAVAASQLDNQVFDTVARVHPVLPGLVGAVALAVAVIDLSDAKPDRPAMHAVFYFSAGLPYLLAGLKSDDLSRAILLAVIAAIGAMREADAHVMVIRWVAAGVGLAAGISFARTGVADGVVSFLGNYPVGFIGFFAALAVIVTVFKKEPNWMMTSSAYVLPVSLPSLGVVITTVTGVSL